jgi:hypothetical protein
MSPVRICSTLAPLLQHTPATLVTPCPILSVYRMQLCQCPKQHALHTTAHPHHVPLTATKACQCTPSRNPDPLPIHPRNTYATSTHIHPRSSHSEPQKTSAATRVQCTPATHLNRTHFSKAATPHPQQLRSIMHVKCSAAHVLHNHIAHTCVMPPKHTSSCLMCPQLL